MLWKLRVLEHCNIRKSEVKLWHGTSEECWEYPPLVATKTIKDIGVIVKKRVFDERYCTHYTKGKIDFPRWNFPRLHYHLSAYLEACITMW